MELGNVAPPSWREYQPEIGNFAGTSSSNEDVLGLQVPMNETINYIRGMLQTVAGIYDVTNSYRRLHGT
jgi:hypothetical protein